MRRPGLFQPKQVERVIMGLYVAAWLPGFDEQPGRDNMEFVRGNNLIDPMRIYALGRQLSSFSS